MKITKDYLRGLIKEELEKNLQEAPMYNLADLDDMVPEADLEAARRLLQNPDAKVPKEKASLLSKLLKALAEISGPVGTTPGPAGMPLQEGDFHPESTFDADAGFEVEENYFDSLLDLESALREKNSAGIESAFNKCIENAKASSNGQGDINNLKNLKDQTAEIFLNPLSEIAEQVKEIWESNQ